MVNDKIVLKSVRYILLVYLLSVVSYVQAQRSLKDDIDSLLQGKKATVGVAVVYDGQAPFTYNNDHRYPLMSVFKFHLALTVLDHLDKDDLPLDTEVFVGKADLLPDTWSPLRDARPEGNFKISVADLLRYSISQSDNNACDILLRFVGGTRAVDSYVRGLGIENFEIKATEEQLNEAFDCQYLNWATPLSVIQLMEKFHREPMFENPVYKEFLQETLIETSTGNDKLKAGLPEDAVLGHKTGSSGRNKEGIKAGDNDMGFVRLPDGRQYSIAVFVSDSKEDDKTNAAIIAGISRKVYEYGRR